MVRRSPSELVAAARRAAYFERATRTGYEQTAQDVGAAQIQHWPKPAHAARRRWILFPRMENMAMGAFCPA